MIISYDYEELLGELLSDLAEGLIKENDTIYIVRSQEKPYKAIIDYYYDTDTITEPTEPMLVSEVIKEMIEYNKVL